MSSANSTFLSPEAAMSAGPSSMMQQQQQQQRQAYDAFGGQGSPGGAGDGNSFFNGSADSFMETLRTMSDISQTATETPPHASAHHQHALAANSSTSSPSPLMGARATLASKRRDGPNGMHPPPINVHSAQGQHQLQDQKLFQMASNPNSPAGHNSSFINSPLSASPTNERSFHGMLASSAQQNHVAHPNDGSSGPLSTPVSRITNRQMQQALDRSDSQHSLSSFPSLMDDGCSPTHAFRMDNSARGTANAPNEQYETPPSGERDQNQEGDSAANAEKRQSSRFVYKLMRMVSDPESQHLISFNPSGTSVVVTNFDDFAKEVLPKHFKHSNFSSFIRQLNMYGFYKVNKTPRGQRSSNDSQVWEFSHPKFLRGRADLLEEIRRKALDNDHARVEARDLRFNVSLGQIQVRQHLEEMQWRLDQSLEQNFQLRECVASMRDTLVNVVEFLKASNGGQLPFDVRLPPVDTFVNSPMPPASPFGNQGPWAMSQMPHPPMPQQPMPSQEAGPSIFVTEPAAASMSGPPHLQRPPQASAVGIMPGSGVVGQAHMAGMPVSPQDAGGPFSMAGLGHVSPFASRRVSGASSVAGEPLDMSSMGSDYLHGLGVANAVHAGAMPAVFDGDIGPASGIQRPASAHDDRPAFAGLPRRSMSSRGVAGLNIQTSELGPDRNHGDHMSAGPSFAGPMSAGPAGDMSAIGLGHPHANLSGSVGQHARSMPPSPMFSEQATMAAAIQQQQQFQAAMNTPLPPSPAVPGYHAFADQVQFGAGGMGTGLLGPGSAVSPSMLSAPSFDHSLGRPGGQIIDGTGGAMTASPPSTGAEADDGNYGDATSISRRKSKSMRTPLKRTASGHTDPSLAALPVESAAFGIEGNGASAIDTSTSVGKRKTPL